MGVFDEGCMGMFNAIIPDDLLHATGLQRAASANRRCITKRRRCATKKPRPFAQWMEERGMKFVTGTNEQTN